MQRVSEPLNAMAAPKPKPRVAIVVSHPIQHFCPQYASLAKSPSWDIRVFFACAAGTQSYHDQGFGRAVAWEGLGLEMFPHEFLSSTPSPIDLDLDAPLLEARLDAFGPDAVIVYGYAQRVQRRAFSWARRKDVRLLMISDSELRQRRALHRRLVKRIWLPRYLSRVDAFLTTGDANEAYYRSYGIPDDRFFRTSLSIDYLHYRDSLKDRAAHRLCVRKALGLDEDDIVCANVGKFLVPKRQIDIVRMLAAPGLERVKLMLVGSGECEASLRATSGAIAPGRVFFPGFVQPRELPAYYAAADLYIQPSEFEAHSVAITEAVFMGTPIVLSDRCGSYGPTDDVQIGRNGHIYPFGDIEALAAVVRRFADQPDLRMRFSLASREIGERGQMLAHGSGLNAALTALALL